MSKLICKKSENIFYLRFVKPGQNFKSTSEFDLSGKNIIDLSWLNLEFYNGYKLNDHHITTESFYNVVIPFINLFIHDFKYNINDFNKIQHIIMYNNKAFDISYFVPKNNSFLFTMNKNGIQLFENKPFEYLHYFSGNFDEELTSEATEYHKCFRGYHSCCDIINETIDNDKTILITGDSMTIPLIPLLCCYFKEVVYMDNRDFISHKNYYENKLFDYVIVQLWEGHPITKPLSINLI